MKYTNILLTLLSLTLLTGCPDPKNGPRQEHEDAKIWTPTHTPDDGEVKAKAYTDFDLPGAYALMKVNNSDMTEGVLLPLSQIVLNAKFIESATYRTPRLSEMISLFNTAFEIEFAKKPRSAKFEGIKTAYYDTVFSGCSRDLRTDCINASLFASDSRHTHIMALLAGETDAKIDAELKAAGSPDICINAKTAKYAGKTKYSGDQVCRDLIEKRYLILSMGVRKRSQYQDPKFQFAYLKYARLFAIYLAWAKAQPVCPGDNHSSMSTSYLAEVHSQIFETIIAKYTPADLQSAEFHDFVENFKPWGFSRKKSDIFQYGTGVMFDLATKCCLYVDTARTQMVPSMGQAIAESQNDRDTFGPSFVQMIDDIRTQHQDHLFKNLGLTELVAKIENSRPALKSPEKTFPAGTFFNEYFFIVDRVFRGDLSTDEAMMVLRSSNSARARAELPLMVTNYVKIYLADLVMETNRFMASIYASDIASDKIFEEALVRSREITGRWYTIQAQADLLDKMMNSYFKNLNTPESEYKDADETLKAINRNIHYIAAFPNMIVMTYFLAKMKGTIEVHTWWGTVKVVADTVLQEFFDGRVAGTWFRFGKDPEALDRAMLLYSLEYLLSTEGLKAFVAKDDSSATGSARSKFFDLIFSKYIGESIGELRKSLADYKNSTASDADFNMAKAICAYESGKISSAPHQAINFLDLRDFTYAGLGHASVNAVSGARPTGTLKVLSQFLTGAKDIAGSMIAKLEARKTYAKVMIDIIEADLIRKGEIQKDEPHPDLVKARAILTDLDQLQFDFAQQFLVNHKAYFDCALNLRELERRRANRLYDEERAHLGMIYDMIKPLAEMTDATVLKNAVDKINAGFFRAANSPYKFDQLDGLNYRMSQYDLLMRVKARVESDIFTNISAKEMKNYAGDVKMNARSRPVTVYMPEGIVREDMYSKGTATSITFKGVTAQDREDFITDGLNMLRGTKEAYIQWGGNLQVDTTLEDYLDTLESIYLFQPTATDKDNSNRLSAKDLADPFVKFVSASTMDSYDVEYAKIFGTSGRRAKEFYQNRWFENDGVTRLPLYYSLMNDLFNKASISVDGSGSDVSEAVHFAQQFNSLQAFVFKPSTVKGDPNTHTVAASVKVHYGDRIHNRIARVGELYTYLSRQESSLPDAVSLNPALARPFYMENGIAPSWYVPGSKNLVDTQRIRDHDILINDLIQRTGDFYGTNKELKVK